MKFGDFRRNFGQVYGQTLTKHKEMAEEAEELQQVILPTAPGAGCFLALGSGLGLVGTASSRR